MKSEIKVVQGRFVLSSVSIIRDTKDLLIVEADCRSKYPGQVSLIWSGDHGVTAEIWEQREGSLNLDTTAGLPSSITLPDHTAKWVVLTDARRYSVRIAAYRGFAGHQVWPR